MLLTSVIWFDIQYYIPNLLIAFFKIIVQLVCLAKYGGGHEVAEKKDLK
jgi:hypothetical protein